MLRRFPAQRPAATGPALPHAPASADRAPVAAPSPALTASTLCKIKAPKENLRRWHFSLIWPLTFDKPLLDHLVVAEPQVGDVRGAETQYVLQGAAHFAQPEVNSDALQQLDQRLRAFRSNRT